MLTSNLSSRQMGSAPNAIGTVAPLISPALPAPLRQEQEEQKLALAQSWFNQAARARREKRYERAERWAYAVYNSVPNSYLADESLLLRAQAADNRNSPDAHKYFADVARLMPHSRYAPVALQEAIRCADAQKQARAATTYRDMLRSRYADSAAARHMQAKDAVPNRSDRK